MLTVTGRTHKLKTWPTFFEAIRTGQKTFEVRRNDRDYGVGDRLQLVEFDPGKEDVSDWAKYTGRAIICEVTSILHGGQFGIEPGYCVMALGHVTESTYDR